GSATPQAPLHVSSGTGNEVLRVSSAVTPAWLSLVENGTRRGILAFGPSAVSLQADGANYLNLYTNGLPRLQVAPAGRIGIATAAPAARLHVNHDDGEPGIAIQNASAVDRWFVYMQPSSKSLSLFYNGVLKGSFEPSGGVYTAVSDRRMKTNIAPVGTGMMERIDRLQPVRYRFTDQPDEARQHLGFIAQDLAEVFPEVVYSNPEDGLYTVAYTELVPVLVAAMQEQHDRMETLEAENAELARMLAANTARMLELQDALGNDLSK
ncbi:MAG: tail fiber domain-containing protein, partial [Flavobacteriales bacterium]|nr:tail fiber domain-containing protein [Flavobacteriales bacterium]